MRIAIANDSALAVAAMSRVIADAPAHELAWVARSGAEAVEQCAKDTPDLILMDLVMPGVDGIEATRQIMAETPCAILIVTATVGGNSGKVFQALGAGALDAISTPVLHSDGAGVGAAALLAKIDILERLMSNNRLRSRKLVEPVRQGPPRKDGLVAIGASAGGPAAVATILANLPPDFPAAIVIIQHVDEEFALLLANWLNEQSRLPVRIAKEGDRPQAGSALIAATNDHLVFVNARTLGYMSEPNSGSYRPSVDVFFHSLVRYWKGESVGVLLTGMGRDGAGGLKALRDAGALTIAQDRGSCVVYGMPKAAADIGAAAEILSLGDIAPRIVTFFSGAMAGV
jgi:two-component system, chemotaxis family, response regulator WspF